ncbi:hypothetical protein RchiOBHm_Chr6g0254761 [Rosa chinensis]|uniref:Uncharacterized protein n=1 Tax=Rosa chinensis TaxID=74649 RepID=A0A2P6PLP8_ROSCH|nr:hypothetical protein RchiOBHm_Chr6g0254761 [Rosa chinensis]
MARFLLSFVFASLLALATVHETQAIEYIVENRALSTPGGVRFRDELGLDYTKQRMRDATDFIWNLFKETTAAERRDKPRISLFVEDREGIAVSSGDIIHVSAKYIQVNIYMVKIFNILHFFFPLIFLLTNIYT